MIDEMWLALNDNYFYKFTLLLLLFFCHHLLILGVEEPVRPQLPFHIPTDDGENALLKFSVNLFISLGYKEAQVR